MAKTRVLLQSEIAELVYALALARRKNVAHANECCVEAEKAQDEREASFYAANCERYHTGAVVDDDLIDIVVSGKILVVCEEADEADA